MDARASRSWAAVEAVARHLRTMRASQRTGRGEDGELRRLAEERGALQYVATLVARGSAPSVIFKAAASALGGLIKADYTAINRREVDGTMSIVTLWQAPGTPDIGLPFGGRWPMGDDTPSALVMRSHKPTRRASATIHSDIGDWHRAHHIGHVVAGPVVLDDRLWGTMSALYLGGESPAADTEDRMGKFVELVNCAIVQAETHAELVLSRARLVTSVDATRHRIERDLHDGAQQHLISLALQLREAEASVPPEQEELRRRLSDTAQGMSNVLGELQEIAGGLHPPALVRQGLKAALRELVSRSAVPVELRIDADRRLPESVEVALYYVVSEALTNALKHAYATVVNVELSQQDGRVRLSVHDNGVGGADSTRGSGLSGLKHRISELGGTFHVTSLTGKGTSLLVTVPSVLA